MPEAGDHTPRATLEPLALRRHGEEGDGPALAEGASVEFEHVTLTPEA